MLVTLSQSRSVAHKATASLFISVKEKQLDEKTLEAREQT
jgi:hypothetical protein